MITTEDVRRRIEGELGEHPKDPDGAVACVVAAVESLGQAERGQVHLALAGLASGFDAEGYWDLALAILVRARARDAAPPLEEALFSREHPNDLPHFWRDRIVLAMIQLGYRDLIGFYREYVSEAVHEGRPWASALASALRELDGRGSELGRA